MGKISGGEVIAKMLSLEGVDTVFGIVDGTYFGFYSSLQKYGIKLVTPRHESCAAHMAGAYARATGKLGVCMASNGPGVANLIAGLIVEQAEGNRVLAITSARRVGVMYPERGGAYQCFDQKGVISGFAKWSQNIPIFERIPEITRKALRISYESRPGVVHLDIPEDIMNTKVNAEVPFISPNRYRRVKPLEPSATDVDEALQIIQNSEFPIIHAGSGVLHSGSYSELSEFSELLGIPITTSWSARGILDERNELVIPMTYVEMNNKIRNMADTVIALGTRFSETDWWGKAPYWRHPSRQKTIQVDIDHQMLGMNKPVDLAIVSDIKIFLKLVTEKLKGRVSKSRKEERYRQYKILLNEKSNYRKSLDKKHLTDMKSPMNSGHVGNLCNKIFPDNTYYVMDGGNTTIWANFFLEARTNNCMMSTYKFGMLGAGIPQTLGVQTADPKRRVVCIIGDGAFGFHPQEIETAVRNKLNSVFIILCDRQWGMVKMTQQLALKPVKTIIKKKLESHETINADLGEIKFDQLAESMGAKGYRASNPTELESAIRKAANESVCSVIHVDVNPVQHMWAPGLIHFKDMHKEPKGK